MTNPINGTIAGTYTTLVSLDTGLYNPTTITSTAVLTKGLSVSYTGLGVVNFGSITGTTDGVYFYAGGSITNQSGGAISAEYGIFGDGAAVTVVNAGSIGGNGTNSDGVHLDAGGSVTNQSGGEISGGSYGIFAGNGVYLGAGGSVTNQSGGTISGGDGGIFSENAGVTVVNAGSIAGFYGVFLDAGGSITNQSGGAISGYHDGIFGGAMTTVVNTGSIAGNTTNGTGVYLGAGGNVTNQSGGAITGYDGIVSFGAVTVVNAGAITGNDGIVSFGAVTVVNAGTITGSHYAVKLAARYANRLVIDPGAVFSGTVTGGNTIGSTVVSTLELASAASAGTLSGLGTQFVDFAQVTVDAGAQFTLAGANTLAAGYTLTDAGTLTNVGNLSSHSALTLAPGGVLSNSSTGTISVSGENAVYGATGGAATVVNAGVIAGSEARGGLGIDLAAGGSVTNQSGGEISGYYGIKSDDAATVVNAGSIAGSNDFVGPGIDLAAGGSVTNQSGGEISGFDGIVGEGGAVTVVNAGSIAGSSILSYGVGIGVFLREGGSVTNQSGGEISGFDGIGGTNAAVTVVNAGRITGQYAGTGVFLDAGGSITNQSGGAIYGGFKGVFGEGTVTVVNAGSIAGNATYGVGVYLNDGGSVTNQSGGEISGYYGIYGYDSAVTVVNAGTITGNVDAVKFAAGYANRLIVDSGAVFTGNVYGGGGVLELASAASAGTLSGFGTSITNFSTLQFDTGAAWTVSGNLAGFNNDSISGFSGLDTIDVTGFTATSETIALGSSDVLTVGDLALTFTSADTGELFTIASDGNGGTDITLDTLCYLRGTRILTPTGTLPIEDVAIGDLLVTRFAGMAKVKWIGRQSFDLRFVQDNRDRLPVRIRAGALGEKLPARDLYVSPGHSMLLDNTLVLARNLVNGVSIMQETGSGNNPAIIDYFQIELDSHDCVIAEGTWSETYADGPGMRGQFQNAAEFYALYPDQPPPQQLELCAPRPEHGAKLDAALRPVVARASAGILPGALEGYIDFADTWRIEGWALDQDHPELPVLLEIWVEDRLLGTVLACDHRGDLLEAGKGNGNCAFTYHLPMRLPEGELRIVRAADGATLRVSDHCQTKEKATTPVSKSVALSLVA